MGVGVGRGAEETEVRGRREWEEGGWTEAWIAGPVSMLGRWRAVRIACWVSVARKWTCCSQRS
ncbi:hypothetical protein A6V37_32590 [Paraburkholderia ginsengiterrae]|uniref:Uncharacterized protein n=1 Tax=Paraburkholderia ginsengiterrae TaxID=1462993 RepID=A0A1A9N3F5_9BURK|nr:hypothetical protein A6V37_32590 [Paraburkholderia ginsengiterrae]